MSPEAPPSYGPIEDINELSPLQQGLLFHALHEPKSGAYFEQLSCSLRGNLHIKAFERAWQEVLDRHTSLRSAFFWEELEKPLQITYQKVQVPFGLLDWRRFDTQEQKERLER